MTSFLNYSKKVFGQWRRAYGALAFALLVLSVLSGIGIQILLPSLVWYLALLVTLFIGTYRVYSQLEQSLPELGALALDLISVQFGGSGWKRVLPTEPIRAILSIHVRNPGTEPIKLSRVSVEKYQLNSSLFTPQQQNVQIYLDQPQGSRDRIILPLDIPGRNWRAIIIELPVQLNEDDPDRFLASVRDLSSFKLELRFHYEDMDGRKRTIPLAREESFEGFRDAVRQNLVQRGQHEALAKLGGLL